MPHLSDPFRLMTRPGRPAAHSPIRGSALLPCRKGASPGVSVGRASDRGGKAVGAVTAAGGNGGNASTAPNRRFRCRHLPGRRGAHPRHAPCGPSASLMARAHSVQWYLLWSHASFNLGVNRAWQLDQHACGQRAW